MAISKPEAQAQRILRAILLKVAEELDWPHPHANRNTYAEKLKEITPLFDDIEAELEEFFDEVQPKG